MIQPKPLQSDRPYGPWMCRGCDIWAMMCAVCDGDVPAMRELLLSDANLYRSEYWYTQPIHFAVRQGCVDALRVLIDAGADPSWNGLNGESLETKARDRGHDEVVHILEERRRTRTNESADPLPGVWPIHAAAINGNCATVARLLDEHQQSLHAVDGHGRTVLHCAVAANAVDVASFLLERGADPNAPENPDAPRGAALHTAARNGNERLVRLLLHHGADPNATVDASGSATYAAATSGLRAVLIDHGGRLDPYDLVWLGEHDEALRRVIAQPESANAGCGGVLAAACTLGKHDLVIRLLDAGVRVPEVLTECRSYLWCDPTLLQLLLDTGMNPDLPDWLHATPLHSLCERDGRGRARPNRLACAQVLFDAGADINARDEDYCSTPLGWAARCGVLDMVELLLKRGASTSLTDDEPWATPLAWAQRRGHEDIAEVLRDAGATA